MDICPKCGEETQMMVQAAGKDVVVPRACQCRRAEIAEQEKVRLKYQQREKELRIKRMQRGCFSDVMLRDCTFDNDDRQLPTVSDAMRRYVDKWPQIQQDNIGLLLHGPVGSGKSFYAACIANALIARNVAALMSNFASVINRLEDNFGGKEVHLKKLADAPLLILDDFGIERDSTYMKEQVFNIIDTRYRSKKPLIVTTNVPIKDITRPPNLEAERIADRLLEMCHPIKLDIPSRRREKANKNRHKRENILGL